MSIDEIFAKLAIHMKEGIAMHEDFVTIFGFLSLNGFKKCHYYHYLEEIKNYNTLYHYYMSHYHKLINVEEIPKLKVISSSWYKYDQFAVDNNTRRNTIKDIVKQWIDWEKSTKDLLQDSYKKLYELGEIAAASEINYFIEDVAAELKDAQNQMLKFEAIDYNIEYIMDKQHSMYKKYKEKISKQVRL